MGKEVLAFILLAALMVCAQNPCDDERYVLLKSKSLDSMSQREYDYFLLKEKQCGESFSKKKQSTPEAKSIVSTELSHLVVTVERAVIEGREARFRVYVDDVDKGYSPVKTGVSAGTHTISLFPNSAMIAKKNEANIVTYESNGHFYSASDNEEFSRMMSTVMKVDCKPNASKYVKYFILCDVGGNGECDDDEWTVSTEIVSKN